MPYDHNAVSVIVDFTVKLLLDFNKLGHEGEKFHQWSSLERRISFWWSLSKLLNSTKFHQWSSLERSVTSGRLAPDYQSPTEK
jgi:hypothetical protein